MSNNNTINLIEIESDFGAGERGASLGAKVLRQTALSSNSNLYLQFDKINTLQNQPLSVDDLQNTELKNIENILPFFKKSIKTLVQLFKTYNTSYVISGDHSNSIFISASLRKTFPDKKIGVIWLDAHADIHTPQTTPYGNVHGMSLAAMLNLKNSDKTNSAIKKKWTQLCNLQGKVAASILPNQIAYIGLRDYELQEMKVIKEKEIFVMSVDEYRNNEESSLQKIISHFNNFDMIYLSFDIDSVDGDISQGTGTPVTGGFFVDDVVNMCKKLIQKLPIKIFEITELNPLLDSENKTAKAIFKILESTFNEIKAK